MSEGGINSGLAFMSVSDAASMLGVSRLRLREAAALGMIAARRDNEGRLRVDLSALSRARSDLDRADPARRAEAGALVELLFDEIEELQAAVDENAGQIDRLQGLVGRQDAVLERAFDALVRTKDDKDRLSVLLDTSLGHLERQPDRSGDDRLIDISDRALGRLEETGVRLEASMTQLVRFRDLLERAMALADRNSATSDAEKQALSGAVDRAITMLDTAVSRNEDLHQAVRTSDRMVERALVTGEGLERELTTRNGVIARQSSAIESSLGMTERAVGLASAAASGRVPDRRGFWQKLLRR